MSDLNGTTEGAKSAVDRLREIKAKRKAEESAIAKAKEEADAELELASFETEEKVKSRFPGVALKRIDTDAGMVIVRRVSPEQYDQFFKTLLVEESRDQAYRVLIAPAVIYPDPEVFEKWCAEYPALVNSVGKAVSSFCGSDVKEKKL